MPISILIPVGDKHFGNYKISEDRDWGDKLTYVTAVIKDKRKKTLGYVIENRKRVSVAEAIELTRPGKLDNTVIASSLGWGCRSLGNSCAAFLRILAETCSP